MPAPKRHATILDIAREAGVSKATVSRVLNGSPLVTPATTERVRAVMTELGFSASATGRMLALGRTGLVGVLLTEPLTELFTDPTFAKIMSGVSDSATEAGLVAALLDASDEAKQQRIISLLRGGTVDAIIHISPYKSPEILGTLAEIGIPTVLTGAPGVRTVAPAAPAGEEGSADYSASVYSAADYPSTPESAADYSAAPGSAPDYSAVEPAAKLDEFSYVYADDVQAASLAGRFLAESGVRHPAVILGPKSNPASIDRLTGFGSALDIAESMVRYGRWDAGFGRFAALDLISQYPEIDCLLCGSDRIAAGALEALSERGILVPSQVRVVGFDDDAIAARLNPPLTTVEQPFLQQGRTAVELVTELLAGKSPRTVVLPSRLVPRVSA